MTARPMVVVLVPIAPSATGNGLAMRMDLLVRAVAEHHDVVLAVVPVAGRPAVVRPTISPWAEVHVPLEPPAGRAGLTALLADPVDRMALVGATPLPPALARVDVARVTASVHQRLGGRRPVGVVTGRLVLAWAGWAVARSLGVPWVLDADDDDEHFHRQRGDAAAAAAWGRVATATLPSAALVLAAGPHGARSLAARHRRRVEVMPNAVVVPDRPLPPPTPAGPVLVVGNLTYGPNVDGAAWLVRAVLPALPARTVVELVGDPSPTVVSLAGPQVRVLGAVEDVRPRYASASVVAVPLQRGSGTRIKVLEAMAQGRPVVSTALGASDLEVRDGVHLLVADDASSFATALARAADPDVAARLVAAARRLVAQTYDARTVAARTGTLLRNTFA